MLNNPLLLVCLAIGCGALLGRISYQKISLGVAGVLFAGIMWGYLEPAVKTPDALATFGLALFVYAIGLSSSDFLIDAWSHGGWRFLLIPPTAIGAAFLVGADTIARTVLAPSELPLGVVTALIGAPVFVVILSVRRPVTI